MIDLWRDAPLIRLIIGIVPRGRADALTAEAFSCGATGGTVARGRGTAPSTFLSILGLCDSAKEIVFIAAPDSKAKNILSAIKRVSSDTKKSFNGVICTMDLDFFLSSGEAASNNSNDNIINGRADKMEESMINDNSTKSSFGDDNSKSNSIDLKKVEPGNRLITFIVNRGFSDAVMDAARAAGARGGTVITAHGTAGQNQDKFFGVDIVPEKDMILILCKGEIVKDIIDSVSNLDFLKKRGSGVVFASRVDDFTLLGGKF